MKFRIVTPVIAFVLFSSMLQGQDDGFSASAPESVRAGDQFQYIIEGSEQGDVTLPSMNDFQLLAGPFSSFSSRSQWINGRMTMETVVTYTYVFRAVREGEYTVEPATVNVGRKTYMTNEVKITVTAGSAPAPVPGNAPSGENETTVQPDVSGDNSVFLRIIPSKREVYLGEQLVSGLKVYTRVNTRPASSATDIPYEGFYKNTLEPDATAQREEINGEQYVTQVIQRHILIPQKTGNVVIEPYESDWMIQQRVQRRTGNDLFDNFFDDPFFDNYQDVPVTLATLPVTIRVKPLPEGAPEGFKGAVGNFSMNANLSTDEVEINEALSLKITIRGTGNLPLLGEPDVNLPLDHDIYDVTRSLNTSTAGNTISGSVTFEYPIVARHAGRFRIPPVRFAWFDPQTGSYHTSATSEFNFTVLKGENGEDAGAVYVPGVMQERVENIGTDIRDITRSPQLFTPLAVSLISAGWYRWLFPALLLLAFFLGLMIRLLARRNADLTLVRNRQANKLARTRLKNADRFRKSGDQDRFYEEVGKAIWGYLSDKLNIELSDLSRDMIINALIQRGVSGDLQDEFLRILDESEFSRFAPTSEKSDVNRLFTDAATLIRNLENSL